MALTSQIFECIVLLLQDVEGHFPLIFTDTIDTKGQLTVLGQPNLKYYRITHEGRRPLPTLCASVVNKSFVNETTAR